MSQDVVINGTTYPGVESISLQDSEGNARMYFPNAVRYVPQTLTDEQKAQARENIGAASADEVSELSKEIAKLEQGSGTSTAAEQVDDTILVDNAYDASTAKFNYRLYSSGTETTLNGCVLLDYAPVKYDPDVYVLISGIESLGVRWDTRFTVNYFDADKNALALGQKDPSEFSSYLKNDFDGTLPCSFRLFRPANTVEGIENTEFVRIRLAITSDDTAISTSDCEGLVVKIATKGTYSADAKGIPSHWEKAVEEKTQTVQALQEQGGKNCVSFAWASDTHIPDNDCGRTDYIGRVMANMLDNCDIPFAVISGDAGTRGALATEAEYLECYEQMTEHLAPLWGTDRLLVSIGNHDGCWGRDETASPKYYRRQFSPERMWSTYFRGQALDFRKVFSDNGLYYYVDNIPQKTRFIVLNSQFEGEYSTDTNGFAVNNRFATSCYGQEQLDWLADVALDMPSGYGAVIITHVPPRAVNGGTTPYTVDYAQFIGIINAYINKTTYSGSFSGVAGWTSNNVSVNFADAQGEIIAMFAGHVHEDTVDTETLDCPIITITATGASENEGNPNYNRPFGTDEEMSFDVVSINRATKMIYCTRVGAGVDRAVSYDKALPATYTVANTLTNATNSNKATSITEGTAYTGTITADSGYTLDSVTVTMGGVDVTSSAVSNGVISIVSVTGDIVITATASVTQTEPSYTNLAEPNDTNTTDWSIWINNARMGSDGSYRSSTNSMVTNYIPVNRVGSGTPETLYFKNTGITSAGNGVTNGYCIGLFQNVGDASCLFGGFPQTFDGNTTYGSTVTYHENGELASLHIGTMEYNTTLYVRLCLANTVDMSQVIISKTPIE